MSSESGCPFANIGCDIVDSNHNDKRPIKHLTLCNASLKVLKETSNELTATATRTEAKYNTLIASANGVICGSSPAFVWRISNWSEKQKAAKIRIAPWIVSPQFETELNGYSFHAMIAPNGFSNGVNEDLSIFVQLVDSPMNPILTWPFSRQIRITIYDQRAEFCRRRNLQAVIEPENVPDNEEYLRRPRQNEQNAPFGIAAFCPLKALKGSYISNDELYIGFDTQ